MGTKTRVIAVLWLWGAVNYLDRVVISFAGPAIMKSLSLTPASFGIILSSFGLGYLLAQIPGGLIADKFGTKFVLVTGPIVWGLFTGLTGLATALLTFVAIRACFGIAEGLSVAAIMRGVGDEFPPEERAGAMGIILTGFAVGPAIAGPFVGGLTHAYGWRVMFFLMVIPALLASIVNVILFPSKHPPRPHDQLKKAPSSLRAILLRREFWLLGSFYFAYNIGFWGFISWMPSYLALARHIALASVGALAGLPYVFAFFGLLLGGWLGTGYLRAHRALLIGICVVCAAFSLIAAYSAENLPQTLAALSGTAFFLYGSQGCVSAVILDLAPVQNRAAYSACTSTFGQIGGLVAPAAVGFLLTRTGEFASGFAFMVGALFVSASFILALIPSLSRANAVPKQIAIAG